MPWSSYLEHSSWIPNTSRWILPLFFVFFNSSDFRLSLQALSRKAYILSVQGKYSEALDSVNAALGYVIMLSKTNPANSKSDVASDSQRTELLTQRYEYQQRIQEQRHENELHLLLSHTSIKPDDSKSAVYGLTSIPAPENSSAINKADIDKIDELFCQLKSLHSQLLQDPTAYELPIKLISQTDNCVNTLYNCSTLRVHVRTSASLGTILLPLIKSLQNNLKIHKHNISNYRTLSLAYGLLASVLNKEFSAKQIVFSEGASSGGFMKEVFQSVVDAMRSRMSDTNDVSQQQLKSATNQLVSAFIRLQIVCVNGEFSLSAEGNPAVAAAVDLKDPSLSSSTVYPPLSDLCATNTSLLVELVDWCSGDVTLVWSLTELLHAVYLSKKGATKLKEAIHLEFPINWHHSLKYSSVIMALVTLLVTLVQPVQSTDEMSKEIANIQRTKALEKVLGMFLTLSQWDEVSKASSSASKAVTRLLLLKVGDNNAITAVLQCMKDFPQHSVNCLAILMNLATNAEVREEVATQHGLDLALASLTHSVAAAGVEPHACIANKENIDINARYTGLLSRLVSVTAVSDRLKSAANFELLCHRLQQCCMLLVNSQLPPSPLTDHTDADDGDESAIKWTKQERGYIITILATLTQNNQAFTTKVSLDSLINTNSKYNLIVSLMSVFPEPRTELGEVTAASVSLSPCNIESPLLLGNAACCLLNYADNASLIPAIFLGRSKFTARSKFAAISSSSSSSIVDTSDETALNIDKMICAMATCTDTRVRKNISILIAKGCRNEAVKERMTALRGMEMIRALNSLSK